MDGGEPMSGQVLEGNIAPKRKRMLDMVLALGGLKEEAAIPLSKVNEEIAHLKQELAPLTAEILGFPDIYFEEFLASVQRSGVTERIRDQGILSEAMKRLEEADTITQFKGIRELNGLLEERLRALTVAGEPTHATEEINLSKTLAPLAKLSKGLEQKISTLEETARAEQEAARSELDALVEDFLRTIGNLRADPDTGLDALQKIGTQTRYGPFLRTTAQVKRGKREDRIATARFEALLEDNIVTELRRGLILFALSKMGSKTVVQLSELLKTEPRYIQGALVSMIGRGEVEMVGLEGDAPVFSRTIGKAPDTTTVLKRTVQQLRSIVKSLKGTDRESVDKSLRVFESALERLLLLGEYNETNLADDMKEIKTLVDTATEGILAAQALGDSEELKLLIGAGLEAFTRFRLKITLEKGPNLVSGVNVYGEKLDSATYDRIMTSYLDNELERGTILILIRELGAMTAKDLSEKTRIPQDRVLQHLLRMKRDELLTTGGESHGYLLYDVPRTLSVDEIIVQTIGVQVIRLAQAKADLEAILAELTPANIGKLTTALEVFSKARDNLAKVEIDGSVVSGKLLTDLEDKIKSTLALSYRTRTRIPSTRPKVTVEDLIDLDVPSVLEEYRDMMGYAPLLGFGTIEWEQAKCLGCKSCEIACPEDAIKLTPVLDLPKVFEFSEDQLTTQPVNRALFYRTVRNLAASRPESRISLREDTPGFGTVEVDLWLCVACRTCVRRCPGVDNGALVLDLKWNLPEVVRHMTAQS
jgi:ferredoxin/DNA-binding IscR family transcriptional regulator